MQLAPDIMQVLTDYNSDFRFYTEATVLSDDGKKVVSPAIDVCEIIDRTTKTAYCWGKGPNEMAALRDAITKIPTADKPLTPAQRAQATNTAAKNTIDEQAKRIAELEQRLAETSTPTPAKSSRSTKVAV